MTILISGGCKNGKSSLAQDFACSLAQKTRKPPLYFATMIPHDREDDERIQKHRADRKNLGFETIECGKNVGERAGDCAGRAVLFDSVTALVANELFDTRTDFDITEAEAARIVKKIQANLSAIIEKSESLIFVSDGIFRDGKIYNETTELYRRILAQTENFIAKKADTVMEMVTGIRNEKLEMSNKNTLSFRASNATREILSERDHNFQFSTFNFHLVIGGSYQGKTAWTKSEFSLSDDDICVCTENELPDFSKKCLSHYENYVAYCLKHNLPPKTDFSDCVSSANEHKIIICDDIFCGVVPIDSFQRKWREETGLALQKIAKTANVTRIFCGIAEKLQ